MQFLPAPARPHPAAGEVHVWRAGLERESSDAVLRRVLGRYLDEEPDAIELARGEHGKPRLAAEPGRLAFNLSHSGELALVAVSQGREVGVDIEKIEPARDLLAVAERAFAPEAAASVRAAPDRPGVFYELWARHEARLKCLGVGLAGAPFVAAPGITVETLSVSGDHAAAVAFTGSAPQIHFWTLE